MNFYNEDEKKEGAPAAPGASSFKKTTAFGKGSLFSRSSGGGIMDKLKNLSRKDMALVGIGLSVLVTAPVAEYMMSKPSSENPVLAPGFGSRDAANGQASLYEPGINALSQGSPDGSGEVITPLSSRDPSSLILGSQPAQPVMPVVSAAPPPSSSMRDAMKDAGRNAFSEASKSAGAPTPIPRMAAALRSMSFYSGGEGTNTRSGGTDGKIMANAKSASGKAASHAMVGPVAMPGYKGVATNTPNSSSKGAFERLRSQADKSASNFNGDSAIHSLDKAAADAVDIGSGRGGMGAGGDSDKTAKTSGNSTKDSKEKGGESLAETLAKNAAIEAQKWEFYKKYEIPKMFINAIVTSISSAVGDTVKDLVNNMLGNKPGAAPKCWVPAGGSIPLTSGLTPDQIGQAKKDCATYGAVQSPVYHSTAGDKATATTVDDVCPCGKGASPTTDKPKTGSDVTPNSQQSVVSANTAAAALGNFDSVLSAMITDTGNAVNNKSNKDTVVASAKSIAGGFQELNNRKGATLNLLRTASAKAASDNAAYNNSILTARQGYQASFDKNQAALTQMAKLETDLGDCTNPAVKMQKLSNGNTATMTPEKCKAISGWIADWKKYSKTALEGADSDINKHTLAKAEIDVQIDYVNKKIDNTIAPAYDGIFNAYTKLNLNVNAITELQPAIDAVNAMTGKLDGKTTAAKSGAAKSVPGKQKDAASGPPIEQAISLRALDSKSTWDQYKLVPDETVKSNEGTNWAVVVNAIASQQKSPDNSAPDMVSNYMRSDEISANLAGKASDFARIKQNLDTTDSNTEALKKTIVSQFVDPSYFPGTTAANANTALGKPSGKDDTPPANNNLVPSATAETRTNARDIAAADSATSGLDTKLKQLPATYTDDRYAPAMANAKTNLAAANTALGQMKTAQATMTSPTASAEDRTKAAADYKAAKKTYDDSMVAARTNADMAQTLCTNSQSKPVQATNGPALTATQQDQVNRAKTAIAACYSLANGARYPQSQCSVIGVATRIQGMETVQDASTYSPSSFVSKYLDNSHTASDLVVGCRKDLTRAQVIAKGCKKVY